MRDGLASHTMSPPQVKNVMKVGCIYTSRGLSWLVTVDTWCSVLGHSLFSYSINALCGSNWSTTVGSGCVSGASDNSCSLSDCFKPVWSLCCPYCLPHKALQVRGFELGATSCTRVVVFLCQSRFQEGRWPGFLLCLFSERKCLASSLTRHSE